MFLLDLAVFTVPILGAFLTTWLLVPVVKRAAPLLGLVDMPSARRIHDRPIPRCGGLAVFAGFHIGCAILYLTPALRFSARLDVDWWRHMLLLSGLVAGIGLLDDMVEIKPLVKLGGQFAVASLAFAAGMRVTNVLGLQLPFLVNYGVTMFWFLGAMNAFNLIDGMDGVAAGLGGIAALAIGGQFILQRHPGDMLVALALAAACLAFLRFNFNPASVFLGDAGSMFIGFAIAAMALATNAKGTTIATVSVPLVAVGIPAFDTFLAIWRRSMRGMLHRGSATGAAAPSGRVFGADLEHLHHRLQRRGLSQRRVALVLYTGAVLLSLVALTSLVAHSHAIGIYVLTFMIGTYVVVRHLAYVELWYSTAVLLRGIRRPPRRTVAVLLYPILDLGLMSAALAAGLVLATPWQGVAGLRDAWLAYVPWWVSFPFFSMVAVQAYRRVWSRARVTEFALIGLALFAGVTVSFAVSEFLGFSLMPHHAVLYVVYAALVTPLILGLRVLPRLVQDIGGHLQFMCARHHREKVVRTLVYGAGCTCTLYLRERSFASPDPERRCRRVVGLIDDDTNLHGRYVHGCRVLGGIDTMEHMLSAREVDQVVVTANLPGHKMKQVQATAARAGVALVVWHTHFHAGEPADLRLRLGHLLHELTLQLVNLPAADIAEETDCVLARIAQVTAAKSCFLALQVDTFHDRDRDLALKGCWPPEMTSQQCLDTVRNMMADPDTAVRLNRATPFTMRDALMQQRHNDQCTDPTREADATTLKIVCPIRHANQFAGLLVLDAVPEGVAAEPENLRLLNALSHMAALGVIREEWESGNGILMRRSLATAPRPGLARAVK